MAQRVCVVVDSAERGLLPDDCHRRACSSFSILHGGKTGLPVHVNPGHDPGGSAAAMLTHHLIGAGEDRGRHRDAECLEVDNQLELDWRGP